MNRVVAAGVTLGSVVALGVMASHRTPTYRRDVAAILEKNCVACHSPGRVAPMSFATYEEARPWARQIKAVVTGKKMPPGVIEKHYGLFGDDGTLSQTEIDIIAQWVDAGAPEGTAQDSSVKQTVVSELRETEDPG